MIQGLRSSARELHAVVVVLLAAERAAERDEALLAAVIDLNGRAVDAVVVLEEPLELAPDPVAVRPGLNEYGELS